MLYDPLCIPDHSEGFVFQDPAEIICIEGADRYCHIYCTGGVQYNNVSFSLKEIEKLLPPGMFLRVHRSHIVSRLHIRKMNKTVTRVYCFGDRTIRIGAR